MARTHPPWLGGVCGSLLRWWALTVADRIWVQETQYWISGPGFRWLGDFNFLSSEHCSWTQSSCCEKAHITLWRAKFLVQLQLNSQWAPTSQLCACTILHVPPVLPTVASPRWHYCSQSSQITDLWANWLMGLFKPLSVGMVCCLILDNQNWDLGEHHSYLKYWWGPGTAWVMEIYYYYYAFTKLWLFN